MNSECMTNRMTRFVVHPEQPALPFSYYIYLCFFLWYPWCQIPGRRPFLSPKILFIFSEDHRRMVEGCLAYPYRRQGERWPYPVFIHQSNNCFMARMPKESPLSALRGSLGKEIVFKQYKDKTVVSKYPDMSRVKPSPLQVANRQRMKEATAYAQAVLNDPTLREEFEKGLAPGESVYHKAKKAFFEKLRGGAGNGLSHP